MTWNPLASGFSASDVRERIDFLMEVLNASPTPSKRIRDVTFDEVGVWASSLAALAEGTAGDGGA